MWKTFRGGVHPKGNKEKLENKKIEIFPQGKYVYIPLKQNIGEELKATVKVGDLVKMGQSLGISTSLMSVPVHASISGKVVKIGLLAGVKTIVIENDFRDEKFQYDPIEDYEKHTIAELLNVIRERGVVGLGGATFPTHIKLNPPAETIIDTFILNAAECEPYLNNDNRLMQENSTEIVEGIKIVQYITGAKKAIIGIEENKPKAIEIMKKAIANEKNMSIAVLKTKYPQGGEKQLIKAITGKELPMKKLPSFLGIVVSNVHTIKSIYDGIVKGKPLTERVISVDGGGIKEPKNLLVKIGTSFSEILAYTGFDAKITARLVVGGPMMGFAQDSTEKSVVKGTIGILALTEKELRRETRENCINCGKCVDVCPMNLMPLVFEKNYNTNKLNQNKEYNLSECIECGACTFICPSNRPLNEAIRHGKIKLRK